MRKDAFLEDEDEEENRVAEDLKEVIGLYETLTLESKDNGRKRNLLSILWTASGNLHVHGNGRRWPLFTTQKAPQKRKSASNLSEAHSTLLCHLALACEARRQ